MGWNQGLYAAQAHPLLEYDVGDHLRPNAAGMDIIVARATSDDMYRKG